MGELELIKAVMGGAGACIGGYMMVRGWRKSRIANRLLMLISDDDEMLRRRAIPKREWIEVRDGVRRTVLELEELRRDLARFRRSG